MPGDSSHQPRPVPPNTESAETPAAASDTPAPEPTTQTLPTVGMAALPSLGRIDAYELLEKLGEGGMGTVYKARHTHLHKLVALKLLTEKLADSPAARARFRREVEAAGRLEHPHLVRATDAGDHDGAPFLVMELLDGADLAKLTKARGAWPIAEACEAIRQAALGLQHAHECGLVHRDIKPANLFRTTTGIVKVLDLGLARLREGPADCGLTDPGQTMGTADYLAPEQAVDSAAVDIRADLYSLGCTLYHLLTGKPPFAAPAYASWAAKVQAHLAQPAPDVRAKRPDVPEGLAAVLAKLLAKKPEERYATPADLAAALEPFATNVRQETTVDNYANARRSGGVSPRRMQRRHWMLAAAGLVLAAILAAAGWAWFNRPNSPAVTTPHADTPSVPPVADAAKPLTIRLRVYRVTKDGINFRLAGTLGDQVFRARLNEWAKPEVQLSEPAYAYLIAFNPTDKPDDREQFIPNEAADEPPKKTDRVEQVPSMKLDDGEGLQAFAVVASRQPLPAYSEWRKQRPPLPWKRSPATSGVVWLADGVHLDPLYEPGFVRGTQEKSDDKAAITDLARRLKKLPGVDAVSVLGFAVDAAQ